MPSPPLDGIRVLDLTRLLPGGLCTLVLADLGADVIKIEAPSTGDYARSREPLIASAPDPTTASASFRGLNRNKRSVMIDLKNPTGRDAFLSLVKTADVLVESFRPGVMARLGLDHEALSELNGALVTCHISGWGQEGPMAFAAGHDLNYLAAMGLMSHSAQLDDPPALIPMLVGDSAAGLFASTAILAALRESQSSGLGQEIDVSISHAALSLAAMTVASVLSTGEAPRTSEGVWSGGAACYQIYACQDGWVALGALEEKFWRVWCEGIGRPDLLGSRYDPPGSATHDAVSQIIAAGSREEWRTFAAKHDCCLTVLESMADALNSPLVRDRGMITNVDPDGSSADVGLGLPMILSRTPARYDHLPAPPLGRDTRQVLSEAGVSDEMIGLLTTKGGVHDSQGQ